MWRIIILLTLFTSYLCAQNAPTTRWTRYYDSDNFPTREMTYGMCRLTNGMLALAGYTDPTGNSAVTLAIAIDPGTGDTLWMRQYGNPEETADEILPVDEGGCITVGRPYIRIRKINAQGEEVWLRDYAEDYTVRTANTDVNGGIVVAGTCVCDCTWGASFVFRLDANGDSMSAGYIYGDNGIARGVHDIIRLQHGFVLAGSGHYQGPSGSWLAQVDTNANVLWEHIYDLDGPGQGIVGSYFESVALSSDSGFILAGRLNWGFYPDSADQYAAYLVRTNAVGDTLWTQIVRRDTFRTELHDVIQTSDGEFVAVGEIYPPYPQSQDIVLMKLDSLGNLLWDTTYGTAEYQEWAVNVLEAEDGGYLIGGTGTNLHVEDMSDFMLLRTWPEGQSAPEPPDKLPQSYGLSSYPNPFNSATTVSYTLPATGLVEIKLFDVLGREVRTILNGVKQAGEHRMVVNAGELPSGIYFVRMQTPPPLSPPRERGGVSVAHKVLLLK